MIVLPTASSVATTAAAARFAATSSRPMASLVSQSFVSSSTTVTTTTALSALPSTWTTPAVTGMILRGGTAIADGAFSLDRTKIRLEGLNSYCVITTLIMNASLRLYSSSPKTISNDSSLVENIVKVLFMAASALSIVTGSYTTIAFALLGLYSKTALGLGNDSAFTEFFAATSSMRQIAFRCFLCSLVSFNISFVLSIFSSTKGKQRFWTTTIAAILVAASISSWSKIIYFAGKTIFA